MNKVKVMVAEAVEKELSYTVSENITGGGNGTEPKSFKLVESENYNIALWPVKSSANSEGKKSELVYNARVTCKNAFNGQEMHLNFPVKRLTENGDLIAGQQSKFTNQRGILTQYNNGQSYEIGTIPASVYREIMALITAATNVAVAAE
jgi:hypothetical protein